MNQSRALLDSLLSRKGIVAAGEFDEAGRLVGYKSRILTPEQADSTARLSGSLLSLLDTLTALYSRYCGFPLAPLQSVRLSGVEYTLLLVSSAKHCVGVIAKNGAADLEALEREMA